MPTYEYECRKCNHTFETFQSIKAEPLKRCPECRGKIKRLIGTGAGIIFKGSGFYETDYRSESYKKAAKADTDSSNSSSSSGDSQKPESKTESKTESKSESKGKSASSD
jgi:putative FmdB family regulatory protein